MSKQNIPTKMCLFTVNIVWIYLFKSSERNQNKSHSTALPTHNPQNIN